MTCSLKLYFIHFLILSFSFTQQTLKNVYNKNKNNIVEIITNNSYGTGFFYQNNGIVLTASHIVNGSKTVKIKKENKIISVSEIYTLPGELDIAVLLLNQLDKFENIKYTISVPNILDPIVMVSNPLGFPKTVTTGYITNILSDDKYIFYLANAATSLGSSGGPVFSSNGDLIGIHTAFYDSKHQHIVPFVLIHENFNNIIPIKRKYGKYRIKMRDDISYGKRLYKKIISYTRFKRRRLK